MAKFIPDIEFPSDRQGISPVPSTGPSSSPGFIDSVEGVCNKPAPPTKVCSNKNLAKSDLVQCLGCNPRLNQPRQATPIEIAIQTWINFHLILDENEQVSDLRTDLRNGLVLISLASKLTNHLIEPAHSISVNTSLAERIENVNVALSHLKKDGLMFPQNAPENLVEGNLRCTIEICKIIISHYHFRFGSTTSSSPKKRLFLWLETVLPGLSGGDWHDKMFLFSLLDQCKSSKKNVHEVQECLSQLAPQDPRALDEEFILLMNLYFFAKSSQDDLLQWVNELSSGKDAPASDFHNGWADGHRLYNIVHSLLPQSGAILNLSGLNAREITGKALSRARELLSVSSPFPASAISCSDGIDQFPLILFLSQLQAVSGVFPEQTRNSSTADVGKCQLVSAPVGKVHSVGKPVAIEVSTSSDVNDRVLTASITLPAASQFDLPSLRPASPLKVTTASNISPLTTVEWSSPQHHQASIEEASTSSSTASNILSSSIAEQPSCDDVAASPVHQNESSISCKAEELSTLQDSAMVTVEDSSPSLINIEKLKPQLYRISFIPQTEGIHQLSVFFNDKLIFPSLSFECIRTDPSLAKECIIKNFESTKASAEKALISVPFEITVDCFNGGKGTLTAHVETPDSSVSIPCSFDASKGYSVQFTPHTVGDYILHLCWNDVPIPNSPFTIHVWDPSPSCILVEGPGAKGHAVIGLPTDFDISIPHAAQSAGHSGSSKPTVKITAFNDAVLNDVDVDEIKSDSGTCTTYRCIYTIPPLNESDGNDFVMDIKIDVKLHDHHIGGSPFSVPVKPLTPAQYFHVRLYPENYCLVNQPITVILDGPDTVSDKLDFELKHDQDLLDPSKVSHSKNASVYDVHFTPEKEGTYYLNIHYDEEPIPESGIKFKVKKTKVFVIDYPKTGCLMNEPVTVTLDTSNTSPNHVQEDLLKAQVYDEQENPLAVTLSKEKYDNVLLMKFIPHTAGKHKMDIRFDEEAITDGPLEFDIILPCLANPKLFVQDFSHDSEHCLIRVNLLAEDGELEGFKRMYNSREDSLSPYNVQAVGQQTRNILHPAKFYCVKNGEFAIIFQTTIPDNYLLSVHYYNKLISSCPYPLNITPHVIHYDPVVPFEIAPSNAIELVLDTSETQTTLTDDFKIEVSASSSLVDDATVHIVQEAPELFRVCFTPTQDDVFSFKISWFCLPISESPIIIPFKQRVNKPLITVSFQPHMGSRVSLAARLTESGNGSEPLQDEPQIALQQDDATLHESPDSDIDSPMQDDDEEESYSPSSVPRIALQQFKAGHYEIWFQDYERGKHFLHVYCFGQELKGSPFPVDTTSKTPPKPPRKRGKMQVVKIKNQRIGRGQLGILSASVTGKKVGPIKISLTLTENEDVAVIKFNDKHPHDIYDLRLYWNYKEFIGSPFELTKHYESAQSKQLK